jgi:hypothetical protein
VLSLLCFWLASLPFATSVVAWCTVTRRRPASTTAVGQHNGGGAEPGGQGWRRRRWMEPTADAWGCLTWGWGVTVWVVRSGLGRWLGILLPRYCAPLHAIAPAISARCGRKVPRRKLQSATW